MVFLQSYHKENGFTLHWHDTDTKELKPQFQLLLSHSDIDYNLKNLNNSLMRLDPLSLVIEMYLPMVKKKKFKKVFKSMEESPILLWVSVLHNGK